MSTPIPSFPREISLITVVLFAQIVARAGLSQSIAPINYIGATFGTPNATQTLWFPAAYSLTAGTFIIIAGRLGDIYGHKRLFVFGYAWSSLWALLAGLSAYSRSAAFFDVCRAMQGIGAAILTPTGLAILGSIYKPGPRKNMIFSLFGAAAPSGILVGAAFSSLLAQFAWWPWAYWVLAILCFCLALASIVVIPRLREDDSSGSVHGLRNFDFLGSIVGVVGLILFNVVWNQAPVAGWQSPYIIVLLILSVIFCAAFFVIEARISHPLIPINSMSRDAVFILGCVALGWSGFGIWFYYFWEFVETLRKATPLETTAQVVPSLISGLVAAITTGFLLSRIRKSYIMVIALLAFCIGNILIAFMPVNQLYWRQAFWAVIIVPWGMDLSFPTAAIIMSNSVPKQHQGIAASCVAAIMNYSMSIGLGIGGTVESKVEHGSTLDGYRGAMYSAIGLSGCGVLLAIFYVFESHRRQMTQGSASRVEAADKEKGLN